MKIVFVILHYHAKEETIKSVASIQEKTDVEEYKIVIVDNASKDGSGEYLKKKYEADEHITVLLNEQNLGFARGNNVGFRYAKNTWDPDYIVLMNNDVYLLDDDTVSKIEQEYQRSQFAVLGPMIYTVDGRCNINPIRLQPMTKAEVEKEIRIYSNKQKLYHYHLDTLRDFYRRIRPVKKKKSYKVFIERMEHVQLHGCFMVFSRKYTEKFDGLDDRTFLYREEAILYKHMCENSLNCVYLPDIHVFHREDASTDTIVKTDIERVIFEISHHLKSLNVLKKVYESYEGSGGGK